MGFGEMGIGSERELGEGAVYAQIEEDRLFQGRGREGVAAQTEARDDAVFLADGDAPLVGGVPGAQGQRGERARCRRQPAAEAVAMQLVALALAVKKGLEAGEFRHIGKVVRVE